MCGPDSRWNPWIDNPPASAVAADFSSLCSPIAGDLADDPVKPGRANIFRQT
jgi:hypothetical protein